MLFISLICLRFIHTLRLLMLRLTAPFMVSTVSNVFMENGQKNGQAILSVFQPVTIDTMLNKNGPF